MKTSFKRFVSILVVLLMVVSCCFALAEGDSYVLRDERYPDKHWVYMTPDEISYYENIGWQQYTGVLWYDADTYEAIEFSEIGDCQEMYNDGFVCHIIYTWICPGDKLGKYQEQSVSAGYWQLSPAQATQFHSNYEYPALNVSDKEKTGTLYESNFYLNGEMYSEPDESEDLSNIAFARVAYNEYFRGYGEDVVLLNGDIEEFTAEEAYEIGGFDYEMPRWN